MYLEDIKTGKIYDPKYEKLDIRNYNETIIKYSNWNLFYELYL